MAIPKFLEDLLIISKLGDNPGTDNGLSSSDLREKFDEAGVKIQKYINDTLIPALSGLSNPEEGLNMKNDIAMGGHRVMGLGDPVEDGDAVPLGYAGQHFAPAGYIDQTIAPSTEAELNTMLSAVLDTMGDGEIKFIKVTAQSGAILAGVVSACRLYRASAKYGHASFFSYETMLFEKTLIDGEWNPLEWNNPLMIPGEEYRTTERHNEKPVYAKLVQYTLGAIDAESGHNDFKVYHGIANYGDTVRHYAKFNGVPLPLFNFAGGFVAIGGVTSEYVGGVLYHNSISGGLFEIDIRYTKSE